VNCRISAQQQNAAERRKSDAEPPTVTDVSLGPPIGRYLGYPIPAFITQNGTRLTFVRIAMAENGGAIPLDQLNDQEALIAPGLIYGPS
jgi:hypothetical protein